MSKFLHFDQLIRQVPLVLICLARQNYVKFREGYLCTQGLKQVLKVRCQPYQIITRFLLKYQVSLSTLLSVLLEIPNKSGTLSLGRLQITSRNFQRFRMMSQCKSLGFFLTFYSNSWGTNKLPSFKQNINLRNVFFVRQTAN